MKSEYYLPDDAYPHVDASIRGSEGPMAVGYNAYLTESAKAFVKSCIRLGIRHSPDFNGASGTQGVGQVSLPEFEYGDLTSL